MKARFPGWKVVAVIGGPILAGAVIGYLIFRNAGAAAIGGLLGVIAAEMIFSRIRGEVKPGRIPWAHLSVAGAVGGWLLAGGAWMAALSLGLLQGEGASMVFMFILVPVSALCWLVAGAASTTASYAIRQVKAGTRPRTDLKVARQGLILSRVLIVALLILIIWVVSVF